MDDRVKILKWCQPHWDRLREAIDARGLTPWMSQGGEAAAREFAREIEGGGDEHGFDPLLRAYGMISSRIADTTGNIVDCPLCQVRAHEESCINRDCTAEVEIVVNGCADAVLEQAKSVGMVSSTIS